MSSTLKHRFIAGAVCPKCGLIDKIRLCVEADDERIECVNCDYLERKSELEQQAPPPKKSGEQTIQWFPPRSKRGK